MTGGCVGGWFVRVLACGGPLKGPPEDAATDEASSSPVASEAPDPVVLVDSEGFEWAIDDGPPARPVGLPKDSLFIPFRIRPPRGSLTNQVLTSTEVPEPISPDPADRRVFATLEVEQLRRRLRAAADDVGRYSGSHLRQSGKLVRNDCFDMAVESVTTSSTLEFAKVPVPRKRPPRSYGMDAALRARIAVYRR